jgi:OmpA-OmpF porin, OOP family
MARRLSSCSKLPRELAGVVVAFSLALACGANGQLDQQIDQLTRALATVEARGALRCAPRELAISRSHLEFARLERDQGFPERARQHLDVADENVWAASVLTPADRCADPSSPPVGAPPRASTEAPHPPLD